MTPQHLHIICFDIPFPPSYGGVIPVYYRIKALSELGIHITLHCFYKGEKGDTVPLEAMCEKVYYYPRKSSIWQHLSLKPFVVNSRENELLLPRLLEDDAPIFFEGLVSCSLMSHPKLRNRNKYFRECNVEHDYYHGLAKATNIWWKKLFWHIEAERLRWFEHSIRYAQGIFVLAHQDEKHFRHTYPEVPITYFPCFHGHTQIVPPTNRSKQYILYQGNLEIPENHKAAMHIIRHIAPHVPHPIFIAGKNPSADLLQQANRFNNVTIIANPNEETMQNLLCNACVHLLITFQGTGIKLKLLNVLFTEGHVVVNPPMVVGTELSELCHIGTNDRELIQLCNSLINFPNTKEDITKRLDHLNESYNDKKSALIIQKIIFNR